MLQLLFRILEGKRASFEQALRITGDLAREIPIEPGLAYSSVVTAFSPTLMMRACKGL